MIQFRSICPGCNKLSLVDIKTPCPNILDNGAACGFALTTDLACGNSLFRKKKAKHTNPPASGARSGTHSWTNPGLYDVHQTAVLASGNLFYDPANNYFCLTAPLPSGVARVRYLPSGTTADAWRINMPLNSKWPNRTRDPKESSRVTFRGVREVSY